MVEFNVFVPHAGRVMPRVILFKYPSFHLFIFRNQLILRYRIKAILLGKLFYRQFGLTILIGVMELWSYLVFVS